MNPNGMGDDGPAEDGCGHPACSCAAGPSGYCSAACEAQGDGDAEGDDAACPCGHVDCEADVVDVSDSV